MGCLITSLKSEKGFTLVEIMVAVGLLGIVSLGAMQLLKMQRSMSVDSEVDSDYSQLNSRIMSFLITPKNCNANFYNRPTGVNLSAIGNVGGAGSGTEGIYTCTGANCVPGTTLNAIAATTTSWDPLVTKVSNRVRVTSVKYSVSSTAMAALSNLSLVVKIEKKNLQGIVKPVTQTYNVPVVVNGSVILGCPKAFNTTIVY